MASILGSDNKYAGGLSYSSPAFTMSGGGASVNGGLTFDLPLATVAAFGQQALDFASTNSTNNRGFLNAQLGRADASVERTSTRTFDFLNSGLNTIVSNNQDVQRRISDAGASAQHNANLRLLFQPKAPKGGSKCFITTAICQLENKPDDCYELTLLRKFRDVYMLPRPDYAALVGEYYRKAPAIVDRIKAQPDGGRAMLTMLNQQYLREAIAQIERGDFEHALNTYTHMVAMADDLLTVEA